MIFLKYFLLFLVILLFYVLLKSPTDRNYKINAIEVVKANVLVEDFNNQLNTNFWNIVNRGNNYNNELQYYYHRNININNGILAIEARKEEYKGYKYTSGLINTKDKFEFLYGKIIFRAKAADGKGLLSAIWLLPADDSLLPEIDIIEVLGENNGLIWTGVHYLDSNLKLESEFVNYKSDKDFSIYELDWDKNEIKCYVNNKLTYKTNVGIPNKKMYLIINLAVGGDWPKNPDNNIFPVSFLIDYIIIIPKELDTI
ncbi:MAG: glycoside hydrolase family 16 protein [Bacilli bacterium]